MKHITRTISLMVGFCLSGVAAASAPTPASAWPPNDFSFSGTAAPFVLVLNEDQFKGNWKQFKGELKKKWANFTDDDLLYIEGSRDKLEGKIQERYGDRKEEVNKWVDEWFEQHKTPNTSKS